MFVIFAGEGRFGAGFAQDFELGGGELGLPFGGGFLDRGVGGRHGDFGGAGEKGGEGEGKVVEAVGYGSRLEYAGCYVGAEDGCAEECEE